MCTVDNNVSTNFKYVSCACNRVPNCLDWGDNNLVCFGANNCIAIFDTGVLPYGKVKQTLHHHSQRVNTVQWIKPPDNNQLCPTPENEMISASSDGTAIVWRSIDNCLTFAPQSILEIGEPVSVCTAISLSADDISLLIFLSSINGNSQIWQRSKNDQVTLHQSLNLASRLVLQAKFCLLPNRKDVLLAIAMEDATVKLLINEDSNFVPVLSLIGHEDWVTSLDFLVDVEANQVLLASGSQDHFIRLWKILPEKEELQDDSLRVNKHTFKIDQRKYEVALESVLGGHSGWVYGVHWYRRKDCVKLLSASLDKSVIVWQLDAKTGIWTESIRVGDVGGNSLGFYGCKFGPDGNSVLAHGFQGSLYRWSFLEEDDCWKPIPAPTGHFDQVIDLFWDKHGRYLVTTSADQTTRIHAPWFLNKGSAACWYEISRPQIHGYNMSCLAQINQNLFASGAEEKVVRIFAAPLTFQKYIKNITLCNEFSSDQFDLNLFKNLSINPDINNDQNIADSASVPALGLTNKAVFSSSQEKDLETSSSLLDYKRPPLEEELVQHTLWPEVEKLYGHGYELFSMTASGDGQLLATACKSTSLEHAAIIIWSTTTWAQVQKLHFHQLTITQLEFSPNDKYLLAVSRDRLWSLYERLHDNTYKFLVSLKKNCLHKRIIWCCSWTSDSMHFATGSRDGKIGIWNVNDIENYASLESANGSVTALSFAPTHFSKTLYFLAVGFENGRIELYAGKKTLEKWTKITELDNSVAHHAIIKRLKFRPFEGQAKRLHLASCGSDNIVKVYELELEGILRDEQSF